MNGRYDGNGYYSQDSSGYSTGSSYYSQPAPSCPPSLPASGYSTQTPFNLFTPPTQTYYSQRNDYPDELFCCRII